MLQLWFRQYFKWFDPQLIQKLSTDLRPDWSGIYAYGARAYPLAKDREALRKKRAFKVDPRAHIGYLIGYVSSNIYRIWVPQLQRVIVSRNVTFDETLFFTSFNVERAVGQPRPRLEELAELLGEDEIGAQDAEFDLINKLSADEEALQLRTGASTEREQLSETFSAMEVEEPINSGVPPLPPVESESICLGVEQLPPIEPIEPMDLDAKELPRPSTRALESKNSGVISRRSARLLTHERPDQASKSVDTPRQLAASSATGRSILRGIANPESLDVGATRKSIPQVVLRAWEPPDLERGLKESKRAVESNTSKLIEASP